RQRRAARWRKRARGNACARPQRARAPRRPAGDAGGAARGRMSFAAVARHPVSDVRAADVAVVGAGAAGLYAALCAARERAKVVLVSATPLAQTASYWAQGGLAAALAAADSAELH